MTSLVTPDRDFDRDRYGRPLITPANGGKAVPYRRCTSYVDVNADKYGLQQWEKRQVAIGLAQRDDLRLSVLAHLDDNKALDAACKDAKEYALAGAKATKGTAFHALTDIADRGGDLPAGLPANVLRTLDAFREATRDLKVVHKKIKGDQALALQLFATGNGDAQYLAGMVADGKKLTPAQLRKWAATASWGMISNTTLSWVASEHPEGFALAREWIDSPKEHIACSGWATLGALAATVPDAELPVKEFSALLDRVAREIAQAPDDVRYQMNSFLIAVGTYVAPLGDKAIATARKVGRVVVDMGDTDCKVPDAEAYIMKSRRGAPIAPKRKTMRC